ncbi:MAG TPA: hypothetical protein VND90_05635 [Terracidiphilus sp.]|nr:hypothetical protein [Terracidiphilus sp.]
MDKQQIGVIGKHILIANLLAAGLEVAEPIRDHGVDLIVFRDGKGDSEKRVKFAALPIQLKTSSKKTFELYRKYGRFDELRIVYVWNAENIWNDKYSSTPIIFCLKYREALELLEKGGHAEKDAWKIGNHWFTNSPSKKMEERLGKYQVKLPNDWLKRLGLDTTE